MSKMPQKIYDVFHRVFLTGIPERLFEFEIIHRDGSRHHVETSVDMIRDNKGKPTGFRGLVRDVTDHKRTEKKLHEREIRYRELIEQADEYLL
jgi:PAS domain S-box-containing protein